MHTERKKTPHDTGSNPVNLKKKFFCLFFILIFYFFYFHSMVGKCVLNIIINIFFSHITIVNYQVTVLLYRLLSNGLAILSTNYYYIHTVFVQVTITQIRLYICTGKSFFYCLSIQWVATFHKLVQLYFALSVYNMVYCNNAHSKLKR